LRKTQPEIRRPFRIPWATWAGLRGDCGAAPILMTIVALGVQRQFGIGSGGRCRGVGGGGVFRVFPQIKRLVAG